MSFSEIEFIFIFLPIFLAVYYIIPVRFRNIWTVAGSAFFVIYGMRGTPINILFLAISLAVNFFLAIEIAENGKKSKLWLVLGIIYNFGRLVVYKYTDIFIDAINSAAGTSLPLLNLSMPLGISFYTFCVVAYLADVYKRKIDAQRNVIKYGAYMLFFPKFISGPITRYGELVGALDAPKTRFEDFDDGLREFILGLGLKVLIANRLSGAWNAVSVIGFESISTPLAWLGIIAYSLQLYFDFYGYSLMAIGIGRMMGFNLPQNFAHPYYSTSMTEFWRRWHMTLSSWFRDYVYIPLGGSRKGFGFTVLNLLIVWLFTGMWHGASGNYIVWGLFLFVIILIEKLGLKKLLDKSKIFGHVYMLLLIPLSWLPFVITKLSDVGVYLTRLFPFFGEGINVFQGDFAKNLAIYWPFMLAGIILCLPFGRKLYDRFKKSIPMTIILVLVFWAAVYCIYKGMNDPFMYFNF